MLTNSETAKRIEDAVAAIRNMAKGTMIPHLSMAELLGVQYRTSKYNSMVNRLENFLKKQGVFLDNEIGIGTRLLKATTKLTFRTGNAKGKWPVLQGRQGDAIHKH